MLKSLTALGANYGEYGISEYKHSFAKGEKLISYKPNINGYFISKDHHTTL